MQLSKDEKMMVEVAVEDKITSLNRSIGKLAFPELRKPYESLRDRHAAVLVKIKALEVTPDVKKA
nr:MAG: hypothetical protein [Microvirus sp.]